MMSATRRAQPTTMPAMVPLLCVDWLDEPLAELAALLASVGGSVAVWVVGLGAIVGALDGATVGFATGRPVGVRVGALVVDAGLAAAAAEDEDEDEPPKKRTGGTVGVPTGRCVGLELATTVGRTAVGLVLVTTVGLVLVTTVGRAAETANEFVVGCRVGKGEGTPGLVPHQQPLPHVWKKPHFGAASATPPQVALSSLTLGQSFMHGIK